MSELGCLFVDMNAFFASVEQQERPALRGRPVAVVPVMAGTSCCIAASYEAKARGVTTGTPVRQARRRCPGLRVVLARPRLYVAYHHRIVEAVESCLHVDAVASVDEMYGRLMGGERAPERAAEIAFAVKRAVKRAAGGEIRCSVGLAANAWLAKVASDMQKPDGMTMIRPEQMPEAITHLALTDLPGIAAPMARRLAAAGITSVAALCRASESELAAAWGSRVHGATWWGQLRGHVLPLRPTRRQTLGHSHVLPPARRSEGPARAVAVRMLHKAAARMRRLGYRAGRLELALGYPDRRGWSARSEVGAARDTLTLARALGALWERRPAGRLLKVGVTLTRLVPERGASLPLYDGEMRLEALADCMDALDRKYGPHTLYLGGMWGAQEAAPARIAFTQIPGPHEFGP